MTFTAVEATSFAYRTFNALAVAATDTWREVDKRLEMLGIEGTVAARTRRVVAIGAKDSAARCRGGTRVMLANNSNNTRTSAARRREAMVAMGVTQSADK